MMKIARAKIRTSLFVGAFLLLGGCTSPVERDIEQGRRDADRGYYTTALSSYDRAIKRDPLDNRNLPAAREASRICIYDLKDYARAASYLRHLVLYSDSAAEREEAQQELANIYFEHLQDYGAAIPELQRALAMNPEQAVQSKLIIKLARSYFYLAQFDQAESELEQLLKGKLDPDSTFDALVLKGHVLVSKRNYAKAIETYQVLLKSYPQRSQQENVNMQLAVCYEENSQFKEAIKVLEDVRPTYKPQEYIDLRLKRLKERMRNQPGAKGFRK